MLTNLDMYAMTFTALIAKGTITPETSKEEVSELIESYLALFRGAMEKYPVIKEPGKPLYFE